MRNSLPHVAKATWQKVRWPARIYRSQILLSAHAHLGLKHQSQQGYVRTYELYVHFYILKERQNKARRKYKQLLPRCHAATLCSVGYKEAKILREKARAEKEAAEEAARLASVIILYVRNIFFFDHYTQSSSVQPTVQLTLSYPAFSAFSAVHAAQAL